jgi:hypothetical protein
MRNISEEEKYKAIEELKFFITCKARECEGYGWSYYLDDDAPESYKELVERSSTMHIPIATAGSETTIYGADVNSKFRFWHDVTHLELDSDFSLEGELKVIEKHIREGAEFGLSELALDILKADTEGQVRYYYRHKEFIDNQEAFIDTCLKIGMRRAIAYAH